MLKFSMRAKNITLAIVCKSDIYKKKATDVQFSVKLDYFIAIPCFQVHGLISFV